VLWLVAFVNAFNFMDGINGISVAQAGAAALVWWLVAEATAARGLGEAAAVAGAAALGFLPLNFPRARVFLGDVGSYFLGAWLALVVVVGIRSGITVEAMVAPLSLYIADTALTLLRRVQHGARWAEPHRDHAYQQLVQLGWSHARVTVLVFALTALCGALGAVSQLGSPHSRLVADVTIATVLGGYLALPRWVRSARRVAVAW
jgi:UDP-N-acetylmuramyl pentapeptide phosphotransferase/UDP-N-acetylglucosamine-1-phosphate transferase